MTATTAAPVRLNTLQTSSAGLPGSLPLPKIATCTREELIACFDDTWPHPISSSTPGFATKHLRTWSRYVATFS